MPDRAFIRETLIELLQTDRSDRPLRQHRRIIWLDLEQSIGIQARVETKLAIANLAELSRGAQDYVGALTRGKKPDKSLSIAMVTYQAYVTPEHDKSLYFPKGKDGPRKILPIRNTEGEVIGAVGVSGAPGGEKDEACSKAGLDKVADQLK